MEKTNLKDTSKENVISIPATIEEPEDMKRLHKLIKDILSDPNEQDFPLYPNHLDIIMKKERGWSTFLVVILADLGYLSLSDRMAIIMTPEQLEMDYENDYKCE